MSDQNFVAKFLQDLPRVWGSFADHEALVRQACAIALHAHTGQVRKYSGEPYIGHPLAVALHLAKRFGDPTLILAAILHDAVEDSTDVPMQSIYEQFGHDVGFIVDAVTDTLLFFQQTPDRYFSDKIEKLLRGGMQNPKCLFLKIADRDNNLETLEGLHPDKQIRMSFETQAFYVPLKDILGSGNTIEQKKEQLHIYLQTHNIVDEKKFKNQLYTQTFCEFDDETYNLTYKNTSSIVWIIKDKKVFYDFLQCNGFDDKVDIVGLVQGVDGQFECTFKYKKGLIIGNKMQKVQFQSSHYNL